MRREREPRPKSSPAVCPTSGTLRDRRSTKWSAKGVNSWLATKSR
jgi:hypothetical protein